MKISAHIYLILWLSFITISCNSNNLTEKQLDEFEIQLTDENTFWQAKESSAACSSEILFKKDGTAIVNRDNQRYSGKWAFDSKSGNLQISVDGFQQKSANAIQIKDDWDAIIFDKDVVFVCGSELKKMKLLDTRFEN